MRPFPKARDLLERFRADGARLVVATSASDDVRHLLATLGAEWLIDDETTSSDAKRSKPTLTSCAWRWARPV